MSAVLAAAVSATVWMFWPQTPVCEFHQDRAVCRLSVLYECQTRTHCVCAARRVQELVSDEPETREWMGDPCADYRAWLKRQGRPLPRIVEPLYPLPEVPP